MDKYEYKIRSEEIKSLISQGDFVQAAEIADTIDWRRVKSVKMLCTISDLYKINRRFEDARDILLLAYEYRPGGRNICYALCELSIKIDDLVRALEYYKEFIQAAPRDPGRYVLQYKIYEAQEVSLEERIEVLEELKARDYQEKWVYELAYLYHRIGLGTRCVEECDEMITMLGEGKYVYKAMELKMLHEPLSPEQQLKYDNRFGEAPAERLVEEPVEGPMEESVGESEEVSDEENIQVSPVDVGDYNTINLQAEIAQGVQEVLEPEQEAQSIEQDITRSIVAPMMDTDAEAFNYPEEEEVREEEPAPVTEEMEHSEVFFGETGNIGNVSESMPEESEEDAGDVIMQQMRRSAQAAATVTPEAAIPAAVTIEPPREIAHVLAQQPDGQISLVVPESQTVEKQITGQMNIEDVLAEWERMKHQNEEKRKEEVRQHVLQQTGRMFTDFDASVRDGLLEQLEKAADEELTEEPAEEELPEEELIEEEIPEEELIEEEIPEEELIEEEIPEEEPIEEELPEEMPEEEPIAESDEEEELEEVEETAIEEPVQEETIEEEEVIPEEPIEQPEPVEETSTVRPLTNEEKKLYAPFIQSRAAREQIVKAIDGISLAAYTGNVIITGEEGMGTTSLAQNMMKEIQSTDSNFLGKIAKISGQTLNKKEVNEVIGQLHNGALIIQKACDMDEKTTRDLYKAIQQENLGIVVVIEDTRKVMNRFLAENTKLAAAFTVRVDVEALNNDTLVAFGRQYAREREYSIDDLGILALHTRIEEMQTIDHAVTAPEVKLIVDEAIQHASRKNLKHFFDILTFKRYDEEDMIVLTEEDFA